MSWEQGTQAPTGSTTTDKQALKHWVYTVYTGNELTRGEEPMKNHGNT